MADFTKGTTAPVGQPRLQAPQRQCCGLQPLNPLACPPISACLPKEVLYSCTGFQIYVWIHLKPQEVGLGLRLSDGDMGEGGKPHSRHLAIPNWLFPPPPHWKKCHLPVFRGQFVCLSQANRSCAKLVTSFQDTGQQRGSHRESVCQGLETCSSAPSEVCQSSMRYLGAGV